MPRLSWAGLPAYLSELRGSWQKCLDELDVKYRSEFPTEMSEIRDNFQGWLDGWLWLQPLAVELQSRSLGGFYPAIGHAILFVKRDEGGDLAQCWATAEYAFEVRSVAPDSTMGCFVAADVIFEGDAVQTADFLERIMAQARARP